jgi:hypothetical protein
MLLLVNNQLAMIRFGRRNSSKSRHPRSQNFTVKQIFNQYPDDSVLPVFNNFAKAFDSINSIASTAYCIPPR